MRFVLLAVYLLPLVPAVLPAQSFTFTIDSVVIPYDPATGIGTATAQVLLSQDLAPGETAVPVPGFAFSFSHDPSLLNTTDVSSAPVLQMLNGGVGPGLGVQEAYSDGAVVTSVFDLTGQEMITFDVPIPVIELSFATNATAWLGNTTGGTATFSSADPVTQNPAILDTVVVGGMSTPITWVFPVIQFIPINSFLRGDANGDGQAIPIGDSITILNGLFVPGETIPCLAGADVNGDGAVDVADPVSLLNFGFLAGPPPPEPFPNCGADTSSSLGCNDSAC